MLSTLLTIPQKEIIQDICDMQIQSLIRVSMEKRVMELMADMGLQGNQREIDYSISEMLKVFDNLKSFPSKVFSLEETYFCLFKHNLLNNDEHYSQGYYYDHKCDLWKKIIVKDQLNPINLIMN